MQITDSEIRNLASNMRCFNHACQLASSGKVTDVRYNHSLNAYYAVVSDHYSTSKVMIYLDNQQKLSHYHCSCSSSQYLNGACAHVLAVLKVIEASNRENQFSNLSQKIACEEILNISAPQEESPIGKVVVHTEMALCSDEIQKNALNNYYLQFKIGLSKTYILKDFYELFDAINKHEDLQFGKEFTFLPDIHTFSTPFQKTLHYLSHLVEISDHSNVRFFDGKKVYLSNHQLKEVLRFWLNHHITFENRNVEVSDDTFPDYIDLKLQAGSIVVDVSKLKKITSIIEDDTILVDDQILYLLDHDTAKKLHPFLLASRMPTSEVYFEQQQRKAFIENVIPQLETIKTIPESIQNLYRHGRLKASLYLDRSFTGIIAELNYTYGNYTFTPFSKNEIPFDHGRQVIRDIKKEQKIMHILEKSEFNVSIDKLSLDDDDKIRYFIFEYLPHLQDNMDVYYSEGFKKMIQKRTIKSVITFNKDINLFEVDLDLDELSFPEFSKIMESYHRKSRYFRLKDGSFLSLDDSDTIKTLRMADDLNISKENFRKGKLMLPLNRAFYLNDNFDMSADEAFQLFMQRFNINMSSDITLPSALEGTLRDYQAIGFQWLKTLSFYGLGGILADDMGLGKTLQSITYIVDYQSQKNGCHLIVSPTSLVFNWEEEIKRFAPELKLLIVSGNQLERQNKIEMSMDYDIVLTSYPLLRRDIEHYLEFTYDTCILDEAQYIKNDTSLNARAAKQINAKVRFALTGTPIENNLAELWSIFDFILPGYFSNHHHFRNKYEIPIIKEQDKNAEKLLQKQIQPFILRRLKKDVLNELPEKFETKIPVKMTPKQEKVYFSYLKECQIIIEEETKKYGKGKVRFNVLTRLLHLRQLCNHPKLFLESYDGQSGKLNILIELLREAIEGGHRVLVFSQFTTMLEMIGEELEHLETDYYYLDGNTKMDERGNLVKAFNQGKRPVFLISLKAGGTGLNLVGADMVIHVDPWWNPAVEDQATDRAYRIGQNKDVHVIKLITSHTVEEKIYELQKKKKNLIEGVIQPGENFVTHLSENEIYDLFSNDR